MSVCLCVRPALWGAGRAGGSSYSQATVPALQFSRSVHRKTTDCVQNLSALRRSSGNLLETDRTDFGRRALYYDGIPIIVEGIKMRRRARSAPAEAHETTTVRSTTPETELPRP